MSDKELLGLAAKAYGIEVTAVVPDGIPHRFGGGYWNPLTDDGDALRLAVKLGMEVYVDLSWCECSEAQSHTYARPDNGMRSIVNHDNDPYAATRKAIVVAAAEIGRSMK